MRRSAITDKNTPQAGARQVDAHSGHAAAVLDAEVRRLVHELRPFGVLMREELAKRADAHLWSAGTFEAALRAGVRRDQLELRPGGFVSLPCSDHRDPS